MMAVEWTRKIDFESEKLYYFSGLQKRPSKGLALKSKEDGGSDDDVTQSTRLDSK